MVTKIQIDPYRFLIYADKFQTCYYQPLLHTMYFDKPLSAIKAVQTLSRLNRAHLKKHDRSMLNFQNNREAVTFAFHDYDQPRLAAAIRQVHCDQSQRHPLGACGLFDHRIPSALWIIVALD